MSGSFTLDVVTPTLGSAWVGYVLATRNLTGLLSGVMLGRLSDYWGRFPCYLLALICEGVMAWTIATGSWRSLVSISVVVRGDGSGPQQQHQQVDEDQDQLLRQRLILFALSAFMGVGNMGSYTVLRALLADLFPGSQTMAALATQSLFNSFAQTVGFIVGPSFAVEQKAQGLLALWAWAAISSGLAWRVACCQDE